MASKIRDVIAIDGPAGAGKSTVARLVAKRLGYLYVDTGAMYRALTLKALSENIKFDNGHSLESLAKATRLKLKNSKEGELRIFLDNEDVTKKIRTPKVNRFVSYLAKDKGVRNVLLRQQRDLGRSGNIVLEGRDIGTVVFPKANKKFYLDASFSERVKRRHKEFKAKTTRIKDVEADLKKRDKIDSARKIAPLKKAKDAIYIDTTNMSIDEVVGKILSYLS